MSEETDLEKVRRKISKVAMDELSAARAHAATLPPLEIESLIEAIDFWERVLKENSGDALMIENCGRAIADIRHELAAIKFGWETLESDAVFDEEDRNLMSLLRWLDQQRGNTVHDNALGGLCVNPHSFEQALACINKSPVGSCPH